MKELILRNLEDNIFYKMDHKRKYSMYHDPINNNIILFCPYDDCTIESVCNSTVSPGAYEYLIRVLKNTSSVVVLWSEVEMTTSDYIIYYDFNVNELENKTYAEIMDMLPENKLWYKFTEFKNGIQNKIEFYCR
jgi:hypothetical protein